MKKNFFCLFVLLCPVVLTTGCSDDDDKTPDVVGVWEYEGAKIQKVNCTNPLFPETEVRKILNSQFYVTNTFDYVFTGPMELTKDHEVIINGKNWATYQLNGSKLSIKAVDGVTLNLTISGSGKTLNGDLDMFEFSTELKKECAPMEVTELVLRLTFTKE